MRFCFFFNDTAPPEIYPLPLHDALPICSRTETPSEQRTQDQARAANPSSLTADAEKDAQVEAAKARVTAVDRKSTRLNSSHTVISYAVFCLKKKELKNDAYKNSDLARTV